MKPPKASRLEKIALGLAWGVACVVPMFLMLVGFATVASWLFVVR